MQKVAQIIQGQLRRSFQSFWLGLLLLTPVLCNAANGETPVPQNTACPVRLERFELLNGLRVISSKIEPSTLLSVHLLIRAGSASSLPEEAGLACLLAGILSQPAEATPALQFQEAEIPFSIQVLPDATVLQAEATPDALEFVLRLFSRLVSVPPSSQQVLDLARQRLQQTYLDPADPVAAAREKFFAALFGRHPYARPTWGGEERIKTITLDQVQEYHRLHYRPNISTLILVGQVDQAEVGDLVRTCLGSWIKASHAEVEIPEYVPSGSSSLIRMERRDLSGTLFLYGLSAPPRISAPYYELQLLNLILGGLGENSRLSKEFAARQIAVSLAKSSFDFFQYGGVFQVVVKVPPVHRDTAQEVIADCLENLKRSKVSNLELRSAQLKMVQDFNEALAKPHSRAEQIVSMELFNLAADFLIAFPGRVEKVAPDDIQQAARQNLITTRSVTVTVDSPPVRQP